MDNMRDKILVIIVTYNGMEWLERCLDSVYSSTISADIFIVDNGSTDESSRFIQQRYPDAMFFQSETNLGFGAANNLGIKHAIQNGYDYIYLLNQDAWVMPDAFELMVEAHKKSPQYGILSPLQLCVDGVTLDSSFGRSIKRNTTATNNLTCDIMRVKFAMAAHWLISRDCFSKVGLFSPVFYHYGEDNNYIHRANYFGFKVGVVTKAKAIHDRNLRESSIEKRIYLNKNSLLKYSSNINFPLVGAVIFAYYITIRDALRLSRKYKDRSIFFKVVGSKAPLKEIYRDRKLNKQPYMKLF